MSAVEVVRRLSPASEQRFQLGISRSYCRNLFGPVDHEQLRAEFRSEFRRISDEKMQRWNFDFVKVVPLDGDFMWQRIGENRTVAFTTNTESNVTHVSGRLPDMSSNTSIQTHAVSNSHTMNESSHARRSCFKTPERLAAKRLRKSPRITDYLRAKKKQSTSRQIKFSDGAGCLKLCKRVQTRNIHHRGRPAKQSTLEQFMTKLRPRRANGKVQLSS